MHSGSGLSRHFSFVYGGDVGIDRRQQSERQVANGWIADTVIMIGDRDELFRAAADHWLEAPVDLLKRYSAEK